jgi:ketosteroid isomerase-like protein
MESSTLEGYSRAMSKQNVEIVRRGFEHWATTGEFLGTPHADFVWDMSTFRGWPERQTYPGIEGFRRFNAEWQEAWDEYAFEVEDCIDAGNQVVIIARQRGRSKATGVPVEMHLGQVWTMHGGQAIRMQMYASPGEALVAAGVQT